MADLNLSSEQAEQSAVHQDVKEYYGKSLASTSDLKTTACCTRINKGGLSERLRTALGNIHQEVTSKY